MLTFYPSRIPDSGVKKTPDPGFLPTTPHPLNTSSNKTAAKRPLHPSYTQQHYTTTNVPVVFMAPYVVILRSAHHYSGHWPVYRRNFIIS
jgi:hypothetical protein